MRLGIVLFALFQSLLCYAQQGDTVLLSQITIYGIPEEKFLAGSTYQTLDTTILKNRASQHLGEILSIDCPIYFRNYGNGMSSGINLRGTSPSHTAVLWNGLNVNSFSLGQADFSIFPVTAADEVSVHSGGGSARFGSGAMGGAVLLNSKFGNDPPINATLEVGSFGKYFGSIQGAWRVKKMSFVSRLYHLQCDNDFKKLSNGQRQQHAAFQQDGFLQDIKFQIDQAKQIELHYWYHKSDREIQQNSNGVNANDQQQDENHRLCVQYKSNGQYGSLFATAGYVHDDLVYENEHGVVDRIVGDVRYQKQLPFSIFMEVGTSVTRVMGKLEAYERNVIEDRYDVTASFIKDFRKASVSINLRQPFVTGFSAPFLPYVGASYKLFEGNNSYLSFLGSISRNYRIPTLNDRYWPEVGNVNLSPETSIAAEFGFKWERNSFSFQQTAFAQVVDQLIKWSLRVKDSRDQWYPDNVMQGSIKGIESRFSWYKKIGALTFKIGGNYQFVKSVTSKALAGFQYTIGKQLMYTPKHIAGINTDLVFKKYSISFSTQYSSRRSTDTADTEIFALDPFATSNLSLGRTFDREGNHFFVLISVYNLFNTEYTLYERRALPGRHYNFQINYKLNRKKNEF
jgi:vitamin B12 transporter